MSFVFGANSASTGYNLTRSLRFRASASAYLNRTPASASNRSTWTYSAWVKRGTLTGDQYLLSSGSAAPYTVIRFDSTNTLSLGLNVGISNTTITTNAVFRDPSAWYHVVVYLDTTQATAANRWAIYVNNVLQTVTTGSTPAQNSTWNINNTVIHTQSALYDAGPTNLRDGYLTEVNFIDGQALTPSSFGSTNALTGVWQPAAYTGTYGTNGFYLPFTDNSALTTSSNVGLGKDFSGNGNYWTTNNISITAGVTYDSMTDVPTLTSATAANYCVMNPLDKGSNVTISNGNLTLAHGASSPDAIRATFGLPSTGQWYWEVTVTAIGSGGNIGIATQSSSLFPATPFTGVLSQYTGYYSINSWSNNGSYTSWTTGDVIAVAVDTGTGTITFYKNGTSLGAIPTTLSSSSVYFPFIQGNNCTFNVNFGQRPFTYTPPTGYVALNTYNLPTSTIVKGNTVMDATLYTGTGASLSVTNTASFKPDLVWVKGRSGATDHALYDSVRGVQKQLESNTTTAETTETTGLTAFGSAGFTVGALAQMNTSAATYVGWQWQAGQGSTSSNTNGSITSTVSVNASAGFSVVTYTGTGANATVGHGLGVAPSMVIARNRPSSADSWCIYHVGLTSAAYFIKLQSSDAQASGASVWNSTAPTSSVFSVGSSTGSNGSTNAMVAYCWTPIAGFSAFGSYSGNNSTDGPMVYTGFQPKFVLIKGTGNASGWQLQDSARNTYNVVNAVLRPDLTAAESTGYGGVLDFLSNGFKLRTTDTNYNSSSYGPYIYMAFATNPFKQSLAF